MAPSPTSYRGVASQRKINRGPGLLGPFTCPKPSPKACHVASPNAYSEAASTVPCGVTAQASCPPGPSQPEGMVPSVAPSPAQCVPPRGAPHAAFPHQNPGHFPSYRTPPLPPPPPPRLFPRGATRTGRSTRASLRVRGQECAASKRAAVRQGGVSLEARGWGARTGVRQQLLTPAAAAAGGRSPREGTGAERPRYCHVAPLCNWAVAARLARVPARGGRACACSCCSFRRDARAEGGHGAPRDAVRSGARCARPTGIMPGGTRARLRGARGVRGPEMPPLGPPRGSRAWPPGAAPGARRQAPGATDGARRAPEARVVAAEACILA